MFWQHFPDDVIGAQANGLDPNRISLEREKKDHMDGVTRRTWPSYEWNKRAWRTRGFVLNEFWQIFVADRPVHRDATNIHAPVQSKAVFSYAMAVMDQLRGWEEEKKMVGSLFAAWMWMCTRAVVCDGQESTQEYLKRRMLSIMQSVNWVCEEAFDGNEWVSELTSSRMEENVLVD